MLLVVGSTSLWAHLPPHRAKQHPPKNNGVSYREVCANSEAQADQEINNVRARLLAGGDCWWDFTDGRYIVPKVAIGSGQPEVSSIFAGSVWLGGIDPGGNLKLACQDYRDGANPDNDFWPGPLNDLGITERAICKNWDQHFRVTGIDIDRHLTNLREGNLNVTDIPRAIRGWPSKGNPYFVDVWGFDLPVTAQGLAGFYDADDNELYEPLKGDYPSIEIRGCPLDRYPDEMLFWIYNDQGGGAPHRVTNGRTIQMEVQVQAFAYKTNDALNDMTFQRYKLINRATESIDSTFFAMWIDADLGCAFDDYIGCDTTVLPSSKHPSGKEPRNLMYIYNQDNQDGQIGCNCSGTPTYCTKIPVLGVDYFRGPLDEEGEELGMSSFMYYNNGGSQPPPPPGTTDPNQDIQYYRYITGSWADGAPLTFGGSGKGGTVRTKFAFPSEPNDQTGWSMQNAGLPPADRRTLQASGPFRLDPGATNELIIGIPWVADQSYPAPDMEPLFRADQLAQGLFDNCFDLLDGPDAPTVNWIELNKEVVAVLSNKPKESNNENEGYVEVDPIAPASVPLDQRSYKFEGYIIYQLVDNNVSTSDYTDRDKARIVAIVDVKNKVSKLYNWIEVRNPGNGKIIYYPEEQIAAEDKGIRHTFSIKEDEFAQGTSAALINHKRYYYSVVAYAYNNYQNFDPVNNTGQQRTYLEGRKNIQTYTVIPRPVVDFSLQAAYGDGPAITRIEGVGTGLNNFLDLEDASRESLLQPGLKDTVLVYKPGRGPINVSIFNPFEVKDGEFELRIVDNDLNDTRLGADARWELRRLPDGAVIASERTIAEINEQIVAQYGFSILVAQAQEGGERADETNGFIGSEILYENPNAKWLTHYVDTEFSPFNYIRTSRLERDELLDPTSAISNFSKEAMFVPYVMADWIIRAIPGGGERLLTPAWTEGTSNAQGNLNSSANNAGVSPDGSAITASDRRRDRLAALPNVDIVLTDDKSKWSRCVVIETASLYYTNGAETLEQLNVPKDPSLVTERGANNRPRLMFDTRPGLSVGKDDSDGNGLPDPDGAVAPAGAPDAGKPLTGMGWFPGYAVDVETGQRLNIFFGENSVYSKALNSRFTGRDMLWNPTSQDTTDRGLQTDYYDAILGGQHWVYVTTTPYDECEQLRRRFTPELNTVPASAKVSQMRNMAWAGMLKVAPGFQMKSLREGLIPTDVIIKLRTGSKYNTWWNDAATPPKKNGHPVYRFKIEGKERKGLNEDQIVNSLDSIKVVPNPYYGFSQYEVSQFSNLVKITNLPGKCTVTIYSLDGKFIRQYVRDEVYGPYKQISPAVEWDLKNNKGIQVASGVYLMHVSAPGLGERTLKWMGVARQFDPSGL
jgi:hypothetical protein